MDYTNIWNVLVRDKVSEILIQLLGHEPKEKSAIYLSKQTDLTYSHLVVIIRKFQQAQLINIEKHGRENIITLTWQGRKIAEHLQGIKKIISEIAKNVK